MDTYEKRNLLEKSYQSAVHEAWKQFIANKPIREKDIPPHILRSWKLSREAGMYRRVCELQAELDEAAPQEGGR